MSTPRLALAARHVPRFAWVLVAAGLTAPAHGATLRVPQDHATIQAAVDTAAPGDTVVVGPGTYRESVRLRPHVTLRSAGDQTPGTVGLRRAEATILDGGGAAAKQPAVTLAEGAVLDGFTITGVGRFDQQEYDQHHATLGEHLPDERGTANADRPTAVLLTGITATVAHCVVHDNGYVGISLFGTANRSWVHHNIVFRNSGSGIGIADGAAPLVEENRCYHNLRSGIGNRRASAAFLRHNECFDNVRAGIGIREASRPIIRGNKCHHNRRAGIGCRMEGTAPLIEDNDCYQNAMAGIGCRDGARPMIVGNECYENQLAGIGQRGDAHTILQGNHVHHNKLAGIGFEACTAGTAVVSDNRVHDNGLVAIGIHAGWKVRISGNTLSREGGLPPMIMVFKGAEADISDNTIEGSGVAAVRAEGKIRVVGNTLRCPALRPGGPPQFAVWGLPGAQIFVAGNTVHGWRHALYADQPASAVAVHNTVWNFGQTGLVVQGSQTPSVVAGNRCYGQAGQSAVSLTGPAAISEDNRLLEEPPPAPPPRRPAAGP